VTDTLVLADVDGDLAKRVATETKSPKARAQPLDAADDGALRNAMKGCGVVVNAAMPRFNRPIQKAALESGLHYVDLANDSSDPFTDTDAWKSANLTALLGTGEDPGLSNVFARHAADGMDRVESIKVRDGDTATSPDYPFIALFSPETFVEETLASSRIWRNGAYEPVAPFGEPEVFEFPEPVGKQTVYSVDHEEADTLPRFIGKGVRYVDFKLALDPTTVQCLKLFRDLHLLERGPAGGPSPRKTLFSVIPKPTELIGKVDGNAALLVEVTGEKDGQRKVDTIYAMLGHREAERKFGTTATAYFTGTGAAIGTLLVAGGEITARGKVSPEELDPRPFFPMLKARGIDVHERVTTQRVLG
jgi:saccharopine dehydrogenase (NAD+, L-lysine-forming)